MKRPQHQLYAAFTEQFPVGTPVIYINRYAEPEHMLVRTAIRSEPSVQADGEMTVLVDHIRGRVYCSDIQPAPAGAVYAGYPEEFNDRFQPGTVFRMARHTCNDSLIEIYTTGPAFLSDDQRVMVPVKATDDETAATIAVDRLQLITQAGPV